MKCQHCQVEFELKKWNQRFCTPKCKRDYWNSKMLGNLDTVRLLPEVREWVMSFTEDNGNSIEVQTNQMLLAIKGDSGKPIQSPYGDPREST